jgi:amidohydrolase
MPGVAAIMPRVRALIRARLPELVAIRRDLHAHPELGYAETRTSGVVQRELTAAGIAFRAGLAGGTGVLAHIPGGPAALPGGRRIAGGSDARAIGLRADMDALPIYEETGCAYASTNAGTMHACGHDGHTAILIGAACVLADLARAFPFPHPVTLLFQPAEEGGGGAARMIGDGCLDGRALGPPIARMFGLHGWPRLETGLLATRAGPLLAAADEFEIVVRGSGHHAAFPHHGTDPIVAAAAIVTALQTIASRNVDPLDAVVVSTTTLHGGTAHNVTPAEVRLGGTVRTLTEDVQAKVVRRMREIAESVAAGHGCRAELEYDIGYPVTRNDEEAVAAFRAVAVATAGADRVLEVPRPFMGAEDFAYYCRAVPSCFYFLGLCPKGRTAPADLHQSTFDFNDDAIATGVETMCALALLPSPTSE